jgi:hypothetical protein
MSAFHTVGGAVMKPIISRLYVLLLASAIAGNSAAQVVVSTESGGVQRESVIESIDRLNPSQVESAVYQRIAEQPGLELVSLSDVTCDELRCRVLFSGPEVNPQYVDRYFGLMAALTDPPWNEYRPTQSTLGRREISPGVREFVLEFTYIVLEDVSDEPRIRARQQAACAGAWARVTELRGSASYMRTAHEQAAKQLDLAAREIGLDEAQRLAEALQFGPLARDCYAMPY